MNTSKQLQRKHTVASSSVVPTYPALRPSHSLVSQPTPTAEQAQPVTQAQLDHAARFGHSLDRISILPPEKKNSIGLPDTLKAGVEHLSGLSMDDVKVHYNSSKPASVQALAYTQGTEIHVGPGLEKHLPHEAWHVVQQKQGRVKPTLQAQGVQINDEQRLEQEADVMGTKAVARQSVEASNFHSGLPNPLILSPERHALATGHLTSSFPIQQQPIQRVRLLPHLNTNYAVYNNAGNSDAIKQADLLNLLNTGGRYGNHRLEDDIQEFAIEYAVQLNRGQPNDRLKVDEWAAELRRYATGAITPFNAVRVIELLEEKIDKALVNWQLATTAKDQIPVRRIEEYNGLETAFQRVYAGVKEDAEGRPYTPKPYKNLSKIKLPAGLTYTEFRWYEPGSKKPGARRGVYGIDKKNGKVSLYYTSEHYEEFVQLVSTGTNPKIEPPAPFIAS